MVTLWRTWRTSTEPDVSDGMSTSPAVDVDGAGSVDDGHAAGDVGHGDLARGVVDAQIAGDAAHVQRAAAVVDVGWPGVLHRQLARGVVDAQRDVVGNGDLEVERARAAEEVRLGH